MALRLARPLFSLPAEALSQPSPLAQREKRRSRLRRRTIFGSSSTGVTQKAAERLNSRPAFTASRGSRDVQRSQLGVGAVGRWYDIRGAGSQWSSSRPASDFWWATGGTGRATEALRPPAGGAKRRQPTNRGGARYATSRSATEVAAFPQLETDPQRRGAPCRGAPQPRPTLAGPPSLSCRRRRRARRPLPAALLTRPLPRRAGERGKYCADARGGPAVAPSWAWPPPTAAAPPTPPPAASFDTPTATAMRAIFAVLAPMVAVPTCGGAEPSTEESGARAPPTGAVSASPGTLAARGSSRADCEDSWPRRGGGPRVLGWGTCWGAASARRGRRPRTRIAPRPTRGGWSS